VQLLKIEMPFNVSSVIRHVRRCFSAISDDNFIDFPKYRQHGAYHWKLWDDDDVYKEMVQFVCNLPRIAEAKILDIGCGDGVYAGQLAVAGHEVVGIDGDFDAVSLARGQLKQRKLHQVKILHATIGQFSKSDEQRTSFDVVYSMDVIEHLRDPSELLRVATEFCKPDGIICIGTPVFRSPETVSSYHVKEYTVQELRELLEPYVHSLEVHRLRVRRELGIVFDDGYVCAVGRPRL
jgi:ubiquinone biosynthesis O-methyltransferase